MLNVGAVALGTPLFLAPMAGVTNPPFRQLCREFGTAGAQKAGVVLRTGSRQPYAPAGLYTCEMITTRALVERNLETLNMVQPEIGDPVRSVQLYGVQPKVTAAAVKILVTENLADHIDLNFGCPVPKVTRKGGGSALPWKHDLFADITKSAVQAANLASRGRDHEVPVTIKIRIGIDDDHETFRDIARIAENVGIAAITLHSRTTEQHYSGAARWDAISILKNETTLPVFGNGDVFELANAQEMMTTTGCDGVVVGRGAQGRPWIFYDLAAGLAGLETSYKPNLAEVADIILRHAELSITHFNSEARALREMRKHMSWYLRGFSASGEIRNQLALVSTLKELEEKLKLLDLTQEYPLAASGRRGRAGTARTPHLPHNWLDSHELNAEQKAKITEAEIDISGG